MSRLTRTALDLLLLAACAVLMRCVPHTEGVEMGWVAAAVTAAGALASAYGAKKAAGFKPKSSNLRHYERLQRGQVDRLYGADPYGGADLGMNPAQMSAKMSEGSAENQAELKSNLSDIETQAAQGGGGLRAASGAYARNRQRAVAASLGRVSDIRRRNLLADAVLRRQDFDRRFDATSSAFRGSSGLYNANRAAVGGAYQNLGQSMMDYGYGAMVAKSKAKSDEEKE